MARLSRFVSGGPHHRALYRGLVEMMTAPLTGSSMQVNARGREDVLPGQLASGLWEFRGKCTG